jgi:hypothetical protein
MEHLVFVAAKTHPYRPAAARHSPERSASSSISWPVSNKTAPVKSKSETARKPARLTGIVEPSYAEERQAGIALLNSPAEIQSFDRSYG